MPIDAVCPNRLFIFSSHGHSMLIKTISLVHAPSAMTTGASALALARKVYAPFNPQPALAEECTQ